MIPADVVAAGALSALGSGSGAYAVGEPGAQARTVVARDEELAAAGLQRPFAARVADVADGEDRAATLLGAAARLLVDQLDQRLPAWRARRVAVAVGTSGGGMASQLRAFAAIEHDAALAPALARGASYFGPLAAFDAALGVEATPRVQVLAACASSTAAIALGCRWLDLDVADLVIAGGYDALSVFIAAGFEALAATTASAPAPFRAGRDGMALGEGAALLALTRAESGADPLGQVLGAGLSSDAVHVTAPDRSGNGLAMAARLALADAGLEPSSVDLVSAHGTATSFNDAAEARALETVLGADTRRVVVHPFKAIVGHCLGAGGALESLSALDALRRGVLPAAAGSGVVDPELSVRLLGVNESAPVRACLKLSAAFGGANAALVLGRASRTARRRPRRDVEIAAVGAPCVELDVEHALSVAGGDRSRIGRLDAVSALVVGAAARAVERSGALPPGSGVVLGTSAATLEINAAWDARRRRRGARWVEPRRFPATSPNLAVGQCSIAFGLNGPGLALGSGLGAATEALLVAVDLIAAGDADTMLVVAADHVGEVVERVWRAAGLVLPAHGACAVVLRAGSGPRRIDRAQLAVLHRAATGSGPGVGAEPGWPSLLAALESAADPGLAP